MKAVTLNALATPPAARDDLPAPTAGAGELLVRVQASSVNPVDNAIAAGMLSGMGVEHEFPVTLGRDYAGVVEQVGPQVTGYSVGDEVYGFVLHANPAVRDGSWAELITVPEDVSVARIPAGVDVAAAGAAALVGITAMLAVDALALAQGDAVLVFGATGGVGSLAVQLAARVCATVIAPALPEDEEYLRGLGVTDVLPREGDVVAAVREQHPAGVDAVLDLVSYAPGAFDGALKSDGRVASPNGAAGDGPGRTNVMATPTTEHLERLASLLEEVVQVPIQETYELAEAADALAALGTTHTRGKLAIRVA